VLLERLTSVCENLAELVLKVEERAMKESERAFADNAEFGVEMRTLISELERYSAKFKLKECDFVGE